MKFIYFLLFPCILFSQNYSFKNDYIKLNLELQKQVKDSLVTGILSMQNISANDILIFKNDVNSSNSISPKTLIIDFSNKITDPELMKNYQMSFYYLKPREIISIEKKNQFDWKQLENVLILFNMFDVSKFDCHSCSKKLKKSLKSRTNQISLECFQYYQNKNGLGEVFVELNIE